MIDEKQCGKRQKCNETNNERMYQLQKSKLFDLYDVFENFTFSFDSRKEERRKRIAFKEAAKQTRKKKREWERERRSDVNRLAIFVVGLGDEGENSEELAFDSYVSINVVGNK